MEPIYQCLRFDAIVSNLHPRSMATTVERARAKLLRGQRLRHEAPPEARALLEQALALFTELDDPRGRADCLSELALFSLTEADFAEALRLLERAVALYTRGDDDEGAGLGLYWAGVAALAADDEARARSCFHSALVPLERWERRSELRGAHEALAGLAQDRGDLEEARSGYRAALALLPDEADPLGPARVRAALARVEREAGEPLAAVDLYREAITHAGALLSPSGAADAAMLSTELAEVYEELGRPSDARRCLEDAAHAYRSAGRAARAADVEERLRVLAG